MKKIKIYCYKHNEAEDKVKFNWFLDAHAIFELKRLTRPQKPLFADFLSKNAEQKTENGFKHFEPSFYHLNDSHEPWAIWTNRV